MGIRVCGPHSSAYSRQRGSKWSFIYLEIDMSNSNWTEEERTISQIMVTETMHNPECRGCVSCDDFSTRESCHRLCDRPRAIQRMRRRTSMSTQPYAVRSTDRRIYARELKRWPKTVLEARSIELRLGATSPSARQSRGKVEESAVLAPLPFSQPLGAKNGRQALGSSVGLQSEPVAPQQAIPGRKRGFSHATL